MSEQLLNIFKLCLLALVYLFLLRVLRAVWAEMTAPAPAPAVAASRPAAPVAAPVPTKAKRTRKGKGPVNELVVVEPPENAGRRYPLGEEITVGRAAGCQVTVDDTFVSQLHARVFRRDGQTLVEDLGSTNGTYLNRQRVNGPMVMQRGDRLQVGNTVLEVT